MYDFINQFLGVSRLGSYSIMKDVLWHMKTSIHAIVNILITYSMADNDKHIIHLRVYGLSASFHKEVICIGVEDTADTRQIALVINARKMLHVNHIHTLSKTRITPNTRLIVFTWE